MPTPQPSSEGGLPFSNSGRRDSSPRNVRVAAAGVRRGLVSPRTIHRRRPRASAAIHQSGIPRATPVAGPRAGPGPRAQLPAARRARGDGARQGHGRGGRRGLGRDVFARRTVARVAVRRRLRSRVGSAENGQGAGLRVWRRRAAGPHGEPRVAARRRGALRGRGARGPPGQGPRGLLFGGRRGARDPSGGGRLPAVGFVGRGQKGRRGTRRRFVARADEARVRGGLRRVRRRAVRPGALEERRAAVGKTRPRAAALRDGHRARRRGQDHEPQRAAHVPERRGLPEARAVRAPASVEVSLDLDDTASDARGVPATRAPSAVA